MHWSLYDPTGQAEQAAGSAIPLVRLAAVRADMLANSFLAIYRAVHAF
jgi:hypothetical protein